MTCLTGGKASRRQEGRQGEVKNGRREGRAEAERQNDEETEQSGLRSRRVQPIIASVPGGAAGFPVQRQLRRAERPGSVSSRPQVATGSGGGRRARSGPPRDSRAVRRQGRRPSGGGLGGGVAGPKARVQDQPGRLLAVLTFPPPAPDGIVPVVPEPPICPIRPPAVRRQRTSCTARASTEQVRFQARWPMHGCRNGLTLRLQGVSFRNRR
jgi:hypothetical protein